MEKIEPAIVLSIETLVKQCSLEDLPREDHYNHFRLTNRENASDAFRYKKFKNDFAKTLTCYYDEKKGLIRLKNSYDEFLNCIIKQLNLDVSEDFKDDEELTIALNKKVEELSKIKNEKELRDKFRWIWWDLVEGRKYMRNLKKLLELDPRYAKECERQRHYYYSCGMRERIKSFIETQTEVYNRFVNNRHMFKEKIESRDFNEYLKNHFDLNKIALYITHEFIKQCENTDDLELVKKNIKLIEKHFNSITKQNISIKVDNIIVDDDNIKKRYEKQKRRLVPVINKVDWIIIPNDKRKKKQAFKKREPRKMTFDINKLNRLKEHGQRKEDYYGTTDYVAKIIGLLNNNGYVGYLYENGEIIFDREYISYHPSTATGNAIYNLRIYDFETLSKLTKPELKAHPNAKKIVHSPSWEERVDKIIAREATEKEKEDVKTFVKKYKK